MPSLGGRIEMPAAEHTTQNLPHISLMGVIVTNNSVSFTFKILLPAACPNGCTSTLQTK